MQFHKWEECCNVKNMEVRDIGLDVGASIYRLSIPATVATWVRVRVFKENVGRNVQIWCNMEDVVTQNESQ